MYGSSRGDSLIPTMSSLPGGKTSELAEPAGNFYISALQEDPNQSVAKSARSCETVFTTVGPPKIKTDQYNEPIGLYSAETVSHP